MFLIGRAHDLGLYSLLRNFAVSEYFWLCTRFCRSLLLVMGHIAKHCHLHDNVLCFCFCFCLIEIVLFFFCSSSRFFSHSLDRQVCVCVCVWSTVYTLHLAPGFSSFCRVQLTFLIKLCNDWTFMFEQLIRCHMLLAHIFIRA